MTRLLDMFVRSSHPLEWMYVITWTLVVFVTIYALREAMLDAAVQAKYNINGRRRAVADSAIRDEWFKLSKALLMLSAGLAAVLLEPPPPRYASLPQTMVFFSLTSLAGILAALSSLLAKSARRKQMGTRQQIEADAANGKDPAEEDETRYQRAGAAHAERMQAIADADKGVDPGASQGK